MQSFIVNKKYNRIKNKNIFVGNPTEKSIDSVFNVQ